jgi:hypothetical protein
MIMYGEALARCLEAVRQGRDVDAAIAAQPARHRRRLREDAELAAAVSRFASGVAGPGPAEEARARNRMLAELASARTPAGARPAGSGMRFGWMRYAFAAVAFAALTAGAVLLVGPLGGDETAEAATIEGVVVASGDGRLTVQTLDGLEEVTVPLNAALLDGGGAPLELTAIEAGQVVQIRGTRGAGGRVAALEVRRPAGGLAGWCADNPARCRRLADVLQEARERCAANPAACRAFAARLDGLIEDAGQVAELEDQKQRCREAGAPACRDFVSLCRLRPSACGPAGVPAPAAERLEQARERLAALLERCEARDVVACRAAAQICVAHAALCPAPVAPQSRPSSDDRQQRPVATSQPAQRPAATATPSVRPAR